MEKKAIPIGIENFEDIIKDNYYYSCCDTFYKAKKIWKNA